MRIGIDATALPPEPVGAGNYIIQIVRALATLESGDEWVIFAQSHGRDLINLPPLPQLTWKITPDKSPARRLAWEQSLLPGLAKSSGIDLLHSLHYTRPAALPCASVVTFHDMTFFLYPELHTRSKRLFFPWAIRLSARSAGALIAVSESTRQDAIRILHLLPEKIFTVTNGVNPEFKPINDRLRLEQCREKYNLPPSFLLNVGLVEPRKNLPLLLEAYQALAETGDAPPLVMVGRFGWGADEVRHQIHRLNLSEKIQFTGYVPADDLPLIYNLAQVFVYPSKYEGFGFPPLEAMACGTPTITTAISAMQDHVGEAGLLVPPNDKIALVQAIQRLLNDPQLQKRLSVAGPVQVEQFSWKRAAAETRMVYQKVLAKA